MSDTWYRDPIHFPPYEDELGKLWTFDGRCVNPDPPSESEPEPVSWEQLVIDELNRVYRLFKLAHLTGTPSGAPPGKRTT